MIPFEWPSFVEIAAVMASDAAVETPSEPFGTCIWCGLDCPTVSKYCSEACKADDKASFDEGLEKWRKERELEAEEEEFNYMGRHEAGYA